MARSPHRAASFVVAGVVILGAVCALNVSLGPTNELAVRAAKTSSLNAPPDRAVDDPVRVWSTLRLAEMSEQEKARSLLIVHVPGTDPAAMALAVADIDSGGEGLGGLILMGDNIPPAPEDLAALTAATISDPELPPVMAIDEEGGDVTRLPYDDIAGASHLRAVPAQETADAFGQRGTLLASVGVNLNFGIVADVTADPGSFIYWRTLGDEPTAAAERVAAAVGAESPLVGSTLKHFPGHGRSGADSHSGIPTTDISLDEWRTTDALPFESGIEAGAPAVMFGHLAYPSVDELPATLSTAWHDVLRDDLNFDGLSITDDMLMLHASGLAQFADPYANAVAAVAAGNDALLYVLPSDPSTVGIDVSTLTQTIATSVDAQRLNDAALRMLMFRRALAPDALTWLPPCDDLCLSFAVGGHSTREQVAPLLMVD